MRTTSVRNLVVAAVLVAATGVLVSWESGGQARAQSSAPADSKAQARQVARDWADELMDKLRGSPRRDKAGKHLALQPLHPYNFEGLTAAERRRVYDWLLEGLGEVVRDTYSILDRAHLADISRMLEESGAQDWVKRYQEILRNANARINVICSGTPREDDIRLSCSAKDITDGFNLGTAYTAFKLDWLNEPVALKFAVGSMTGELVKTVKPGAVGKVRIVDRSAGDEESDLSRYIGDMVSDEMNRRVRTGGGWRDVGGTGQGATYGLEGEIIILDDRRLVLRVVVKLEGSSVYSVRRYVSLKSIPKGLLEPGPTPGGTEKGPREETRPPVPATGTTLHEATQAGNMKGVEKLLAGGLVLHEAVKAGDMARVKALLDEGVEVNASAADGATALHIASGKGYLEIVRMLLEAGADMEVEESRGRRAVEAAEEGGYVAIVELLKGAKAERASRAEAQRDKEAYERARKSDTPAGYRRYEAENPRGRHLQAVRGRLRELDEEAYGKARRLDTVEGYAEYRREFREGMHAQEARKREGELREGGLGLKHRDLVLIQRGLSSLGKDAGRADGVFGARTRRAIGEWQEEKGLGVTGYLTEEAQARALRGLGEAAERKEQELEAERRAQLAREAARERRFYEGKTFRFIVGYSPGGITDGYTRLIARYFGKYVPGNPATVVQNMPGGGSLIAAQHIANRAKPDGLTGAVFDSSQILRSTLGVVRIHVNFEELEWIGAPKRQREIVCMIKAGTATTWKDILAHPRDYVLGSTYPGSISSVAAKLLNMFAGASFHVVDGYRVGALRFAVEHNEIDGFCSDWEVERRAARHMLDAKGTQKLVPFVIHSRRYQEPETMDLPLFKDVVVSGEGIQVYHAWAAGNAFQFPLALPPGTPKDRVETLRRAYKMTLKDPRLLAEANKALLGINYLSGTEVERNVSQLINISPNIEKRLSVLYGLD